MTKHNVWGRCIALTLCLMLTASLMSVTAMANDAEAEIGSTEYATLTDAIAAVEGSESKTGTIVLLKDIALGSVTDKTDNFVIPADADVTLDLAGHKVSATDDTGNASGGYYLFENHGTFTVEDSSGNDSGEISTTVGPGRDKWYYETTSVCNLGGTVFIKSGTISNTCPDLEHVNFAVDNLTYTGSTQMTVSGGRITSTSSAIRVYNQSNWGSNYKTEYDCSLTIAGGTFESTGGVNVLYVQRDDAHHGKITVQIDDGDFNVINATKGRSIIFCDNYDIDDAESHQINITVNGGIYNENIKNIAQYYYSDIDGIGTIQVNGGTFRGNNPSHGGTQNYGFAVVNKTSYQIGVIPPNDNWLCYVPVYWPYSVAYAAAGVDENGDSRPDAAVDKVSGGKTVTVDPNGGTWRGTTDKTAFDPLTADLTLEDPAPASGSIFAGWTSANDGNGNYTYTAQYKPVVIDGGVDASQYTLTFESNGGTAVAPITRSFGSVITLDQTTSRSGYTFAGWYSDKALTTKAASVTLTKNMTVYAGWTATGKPEMFRDDHAAYIIGYEDGTVRPGSEITRAETATVFFRLLSDEVRARNLTTTNTFGDVGSKAWYNTAVSTLEGMGIVKGRDGNVFDGNAPITRAEFAAIAARFDSAAYAGADKFTDISGHWAGKLINSASDKGWILGYGDGTFRPDENITRAEAMTMINRVLVRQPESASDLLSGMQVWPDNASGAWYYLAVQEATNSHDFSMKSDSVHETWTGLTAVPDWSSYER